MAASGTYHNHNQTTLRSLRPGDLVEFKRGVYNHWGVYLGNEEVAHVTAIEDGELGRNSRSVHIGSISGAQFDKVVVCIENFWKIVAGYKADKNNDKDSRWIPLPAEEIVRRAKERVGKATYNIFTANCEHFAKWCRYQISISDQADNLRTFSNAALGFGIVGAAILVGAALFNKNKTRRDRQ